MLTETDACCGPMAAAFLRDYSPRLEVASAGRIPSQNIDSLMVEVMYECLIDLENYVPHNVATLDGSVFDVVYECPEFACPQTIDAYRAMRDFIKNEAYLFFQNILRQT